MESSTAKILPLASGDLGKAPEHRDALSGVEAKQAANSSSSLSVSMFTDRRSPRERMRAIQTNKNAKEWWLTVDYAKEVFVSDAQIEQLRRLIAARKEAK